MFIMKISQKLAFIQSLHGCFDWSDANQVLSLCSSVTINVMASNYYQVIKFLINWLLLEDTQRVCVYVDDLFMMWDMRLMDELCFDWKNNKAPQSKNTNYDVPKHE